MTMEVLPKKGFVRFEEDQMVIRNDFGWVEEPGQRVAESAHRHHHSPMTEVTRPELDAKLEAIEARMDGRVASIEGKIDAMLARMEGRDVAYEQRFANFEQRFTGIEESLKDTRNAVGSLKSTTIVTAISVVLAIVLGVAAFNATVLSNMVSAFESGKNTSAAQAEVAQQARETRQMLDDLRKALPREAPPK